MPENEKTEPREPITPALVLGEVAKLAQSMATVSKRLKRVEEWQVGMQAALEKLGAAVQLHQRMFNEITGQKPAAPKTNLN